MKNNIHFLSILLALVMAISIFLPWVSVSSSVSFGGYNSSFSTGGVSGIHFADAWFALIVAIASGVMAFRKMKVAAVGGVINALIALAHMAGWISYNQGATFNMESQYGNAHSAINSEFGLYILLIASIVFAITTFLIPPRSDVSLKA